ncbi:hypothetical protein [Microcoleus vaginatus]
MIAFTKASIALLKYILINYLRSVTARSSAASVPTANFEQL